MGNTLYQILQEHDNNYSKLEDIYGRVTNSELVRDPFNSPQADVSPITLSATIVIPAWNAKNTIEKCLIAIEHSSFNKRYPHLLEVVVVDDGSTDGTWHVLKNLDLNLRVKAVFQENHGQPHAVNTGISIAEGDVIICCDDDMILTLFTIEELMKRHQVLENVLLVGFRFNVRLEDQEIQRSVLRKHLPHFVPIFYKDERVHFHWAGWPENMCVEYDHLKKLGGGKQIWITDGQIPDGDCWTLERMVYGALFSMRRSHFRSIDGFDEQLRGWGWDDTIVGARAIALGNYIIPVYSAVGMHIAHPDRSSYKWEESDSNYQILRENLQSPFEPGKGRIFNKARQRIIHKIEYTPTSDISSEIPGTWFKTFIDELNNPGRLGHYLYYLGRYNEAVSAFEGVKAGELEEVAALFYKGRVLKADRRYNEAIEIFELTSKFLSIKTRSMIEIGFARAGLGDFAAARTILVDAYFDEPQLQLLRYVLDCPLEHHLRRGKKYVAQGDHALAARDFEAVLIQEPGHREAKQDWDHCQQMLH